jgi:hypothetical protein
MPQQRGERAVMRRPARCLRLVACELGAMVVGEWHEVETLGQRRRMQGIESLVFAVTGA